ncbi:zinc finger protein 862-like [Xenia sp. Carnegie-2017]|uniref:zinc finger protein 862-like n=1 Tax=Xenia sp. Carnegie-2017 TaxID=2897299 RepID=UPI001F03A319|nr:zinc finger protein 862-like [Xenia sp. Carnegie-2017]
MWPKDDEALKRYGDKAILELKEFYQALLIQNRCNIDKVVSEWNRLKCHLKSYIVGAEKKEKYVNVWQSIWENVIMQKECKIVLHIIELLLITPFTNAKVERLFSRMNRIKTTLRNRLSTQRLDAQLRVGEEGCPLAEFNAEEALQYWLEQKIRRPNGAKPRKYPA